MSAEAFRAALLDAGVLTDGGAPGLYHRSFGFERVVAAISGYVAAAGRGVAQQRLEVGPTQVRSTLERTGYFTSFPNLLGVLSSFPGTEADVPAYLEEIGAGGAWTDQLAVTELALCSAACHSIYPLVATRTLDAGGARFEVEAWCFRHEPSADPARMQSFRMHEFVYLGTPDGAVEHRDSWLTKGRALLADLGLAVDTVVANDPFFGRTGRLLAANQRTKELKFELVAPISATTPGAIGSGNYHEDHFGEAFDIRQADGTVAHTACIGFGLERIALALHLEHGVGSASWPSDVRRRLGLDDLSSDGAVT